MSPRKKSEIHNDFSTLSALNNECPLQLVLHQGPDQFESKTLRTADIKIDRAVRFIITNGDFDPVVLRNAETSMVPFFRPKSMFIRVRKDLIHDECTGNSLVDRKKYFWGSISQLISCPGEEKIFDNAACLVVDTGR